MAIRKKNYGADLPNFDFKFLAIFLEILHLDFDCAAAAADLSRPTGLTSVYLPHNMPGPVT